MMYKGLNFCKHISTEVVSSVYVHRYVKMEELADFVTAEGRVVAFGRNLVINALRGCAEHDRGASLLLPPASCATEVFHTDYIQSGGFHRESLCHSNYIDQYFNFH